MHREYINMKHKTFLQFLQTNVLLGYYIFDTNNYKTCYKKVYMNESELL